MGAVTHRIKQNGQKNEADAAKQQGGISLRIDDVVEDDSDDQGKADGDGKGNRHAGESNGGHEKHVGEIEHAARHESVSDLSLAGDLDIVDEGQLRSKLAKGESRREGREEHAEGVVEIEEFKAPLGAGHLECVGPGAPADHGEDGQQQGGPVSGWKDHMDFES